MTLVTDVLNRIARQVSIDLPDSWLTATDTEYVEIRDDFLSETVDDILDRVDLPSPIGAQTVITGTGGETYSLPVNFKRLARDPMAVYETTTVRRAMRPVTNDGEWTYLKEVGSTGAERFYRLAGYDGAFTLSIYREPSSSISVTVSYVTKNWKASSTGAVGSTFTDEGDVVLLPRRILEAGTVARWRERRGLNPADKFREYENLLSRLITDTRGIRVVNFGPKATMRDPFDVPVPDEIPSS